jgi:cytochrome c biogenesis protein CcmG, thiol:disulfide interchange protein DsbE
VTHRLLSWRSSPAHSPLSQSRAGCFLDSYHFALQSAQVKTLLVSAAAFLGMCLLSLRAIAGTPDFAEYRGHIVWLDFWASWCGPCRQSFPFMQRLQQRYADKGLMVVAVNVDHERKEADRFLSGFSHDFTVRYDAAGTLPASMNVKVMPTSFLLDSAGNIVATHVGFRATDEKLYAAEVEALLVRSGQR